MEGGGGRERQADTQGGKRASGQAGRQVDTGRHRKQRDTDRQTEGERGIGGERETDRQTDRQVDTETHREND